ncbi:MAG: hypothetical protein U0325_05590 [Polyangiales bacterium]
MKRSSLLVAALGALALRTPDAHAVRVWEEPRAGWQPTAPLSPGGLSLATMFTGSVASPDLRPPDFVPPLAAGGHVGASRFPEGVAERWLDIGFFAQPQFIFQTGYDTEARTNFSLAPGVNLRRNRVVIHGQAHPQLQVRLEFGLSDRLELYDTYALVPVRRWLQFQIGQFRVPFSRQELVSGTRYQFADSSLWSGAANSSGIRFIPSFDIGAMVWGWLGRDDLVEYYAGIFNGKGPNQPFNLDGFFLYAGRVVVNPLGRPRAFQESAVNLPRDPRLAIGINAAGQVRQIGTVTIGGAEVPNRVTTTALGADVYFTGWGASLYGEFYFRDTEETDTASRPTTQSLGWLAQAGYFIPHPALRNHLEVVARVQQLNPSDCFTRTRAAGTCDIRPYPSHTRENYRDFMNTTALSFGVNWYQLGHGFKVQASYTIFNEGRDLENGAPGSGIIVNDIFNLLLTGSF